MKTDVFENVWDPDPCGDQFGLGRCFQECGRNKLILSYPNPCWWQNFDLQDAFKKVTGLNWFYVVPIFTDDKFWLAIIIIMIINSLFIECYTVS
jgi:hypothetical protein